MGFVIFEVRMHAFTLTAPALVRVPLRLQPLLVVFRDVFDLRTPKA